MFGTDEVDRVIEETLSSYNPSKRWIVAFAVAVIAILAVIFAAGCHKVLTRENLAIWQCQRPCVNHYDCWRYGGNPGWSMCEEGVCIPYAYAQIPQGFPEEDRDTFHFNGQIYHIDDGPIVEIEVEWKLQAIDAIYHPPPEETPGPIWL